MSDLSTSVFRKRQASHTLIIKKTELKTLTSGLNGFVSDTLNEQTRLFAGLFVACLPSLIAYGIAQDKMVKGMTIGAVKG